VLRNLTLPTLGASQAPTTIAQRHLFEFKEFFVPLNSLRYPRKNCQGHTRISSRTFDRKIRYTNKTRLFLKQRVRLTGLSSEAFHKAMTACDEVYAKMSNHFPLQSTNPWQTAIYESHSAIDFNARYFTKRTDAPNESHLPFLQGVDPAGVLEKLRKHDLIHGPDNQVEYIQLLDNDRCAPPLFPDLCLTRSLLVISKSRPAYSKSEI
jgi:hypothetical protein